MHTHHTHGDSTHHHDHGQQKMLYLVLLSTLFFVLAIFIEKLAPELIWISLYIIAIVISGYSTFRKGLRNLAHFKFNMDTLMTIALIGAVFIGEWKEASLVAILFGLNEYLEGLGISRARSSLATLLQSAPKHAHLIEANHETIVSIDILKAGDLVKVKPGEKIPADGIVIEGDSSVNEATITGESLPVEKKTDDVVFGGTINNEGILIVQIEKPYKDSSISKIFKLVSKAQSKKTPTELFINKFAKYYTPFILIVAIFVVLFPPLILNGDWYDSLYQGLAVLIVGCPCALILASPVAIISGIARSARDGILIKGGVYLEQLGRIRTIAFDKTGTLTKGQPYVEEMIVFDAERFLSISAAIEGNSSHPLAKAIMKEVQKHENIQQHDVDQFQTVGGQGIQAVVQNQIYWLGNEKQLQHLTISESIRKKISELKNKGLTLVILADESEVLGIFGIADEIRAESRTVIEQLHQAGIHQTVMLTGDHEQSAKRVADAVGVTSYYGQLLPADKALHIKELGKQSPVAMVGDGINDAPALATAHLGIAMGKGTDSAIETADIVLMQDHLGKLPGAISTAKLVNSIIRFNITVAIGLKLIALLLTIPGWLTLWIAILSDMGATIFVTLVSLTVLLRRP